MENGNNYNILFIYERIMITCLSMVELLQVTMTDWIHIDTFWR